MSRLTWYSFGTAQQPIFPTMYRAAVPGGWLVATLPEKKEFYPRDYRAPLTVSIPGQEPHELPLAIVGYSGSVNFVPDPAHSWDGNSVATQFDTGHPGGGPTLPPGNVVPGSIVAGRLS